MVLPMDQSFYIAFTAWGTWVAISATFFVVWRQIRASKQLASIQLFLQLATQWDSANMQQKRARLARRLLADRAAVDLDDTALVFLETLAHMVKRGLVDRDLVWTTFSIDVSSYRAVVRHYIDYERKRKSDPTLFEELEALSQSFAVHDQVSRGAGESQLGFTRSALESFLQWEACRGE